MPRSCFFRSGKQEPPPEEKKAGIELGTITKRRSIVITKASRKLQVGCISWALAILLLLQKGRETWDRLCDLPTRAPSLFACRRAFLLSSSLTSCPSSSTLFVFFLLSCFPSVHQAASIPRASFDHASGGYALLKPEFAWTCQRDWAHGSGETQLTWRFLWTLKGARNCI